MRAAPDFVFLQGASIEIRRIEGEGTPVLLLHEALGSQSLWGGFPELLASLSGRPVIAWSRQGFGRSDPLPRPPAADFLDRAADQTIALLEELCLDRVHLHGHSDGAAIALLVSAKSQDRVCSLVLEAPHVRIEEKALLAIEAARESYGNGRLRSSLSNHHDDPDRVFENWAGAWLDPIFREWSIEAYLGSVHAPTLIIQGDADEFFSLGHVLQLKAFLSSADLLVLEGCGHSPFRARPHEVAAAAARHFTLAEARG